ncbi:MAG TPA: ABC transporter permease [Casimicrobiaceae bacterium]|nr:ABC transporter permease [Casimicrobiaceae bacterium]HXU67648.1 ABC transporter permease [Casimicrobiaceae bacterium]
MSTSAVLRVALPRARPRRRFGVAARGFAGVLILLAAWQISVPLVGLSPYFYPAPTDVLAAFVALVRKGILPVYLADSVMRYLTGLVCGAGLGIGFGVLIGMSRKASLALSPLFKFLFAIVEVAWIPIFVVWFGYGIETIVLALIYVVFFPVLYNTLLGVRTAPQILVNAVRSLGASRLQVLRLVILPGALPGIITGLRLGAGFAFRGLVFAEMVAAKTGIGYLIFEGAQAQQTSRTIVGMIVMGLLWLAIDQFYLRPIERATIQRWGLTIDAAERT